MGGSSTGAYFPIKGRWISISADRFWSCSDWVVVEHVESEAGTVHLSCYRWQRRVGWRLTAIGASKLVAKIRLLSESTPDKSAPDKSTPNKSAPDRSTPDKSVPDKSTPDKSLPDIIVDFVQLLRRSVALYWNSTTTVTDCSRKLLLQLVYGSCWIGLLTSVPVWSDMLEVELVRTGGLPVCCCDAWKINIRRYCMPTCYVSNPSRIMDRCHALSRLPCLVVRFSPPGLFAAGRNWIVTSSDRLFCRVRCVVMTISTPIWMQMLSSRCMKKHSAIYSIWCCLNISYGHDPIWHLRGSTRSVALWNVTSDDWSVAIVSRRMCRID